ncbi:MAG: YheT family hydrolase [Rhodothalassiaceae bacterium]
MSSRGNRRPFAPGERSKGFRCLAGDPGAAFLRRLDPFRARPPWIGGDLQTIRNSLLPAPALVPHRSRRLYVPAPERAAGTLVAAVSEPQSEPQSEARRQIMLLVHGLGGCEDSAYMRLAARVLLADGQVVIRANLRGADPEGRSVGPYHAGLVDDVRTLIARIGRDWPRRPVIAIGFSLGGHLVLRLAASPRVPDPLAAVISVSAPLDLASAVRRIGAARNRIYERRLLAWLCRQHFAAGRAPDKGIRSLRAFDSRVVVPAHGFRDVDQYYRSQSVMPALSALHRPTLALHAEDDPWIPAADYHSAPWPRNRPVWTLLTAAGGHVGFHARGVRWPWYISAIRAFRDDLCA